MEFAFKILDLDLDLDKAFNLQPPTFNPRLQLQLQLQLQPQFHFIMLRYVMLYSSCLESNIRFKMAAGCWLLAAG